MSGRRSRTKGHAFERLIARRFGTKRGLGQARGAEVCDVEGTRFWLECKRMKRCNIQAAYAQALGDTDGRPPVAITKDDRGPVLVTLSLDHFMELLDDS